jgi:hypothetical protein
MAVFYCDGSTINNGKKGQDSFFLVLFPNRKIFRNKILKKEIGDKTINYAELSAIYFASYYAKDGDTIITDSFCAKSWATKERKPNQYKKYSPDTLELIQNTYKLVQKKNLIIKQVKRDYNKAGLLIEDLQGFRS